MILPKEVIDAVCSKCEAWRYDEYFKAFCCHSYAHECDDLARYDPSKNNKNKTAQKDSDTRTNSEIVKNIASLADILCEQSKEIKNTASEYINKHGGK